MVPDQNKSLREIWNSDPFVELRRRHLAGDLSKTCLACELRSSGEQYYEQFYTDCISSTARQNLETNRSEYLRGDITLQSLPVTLGADLLYRCNFSCMLCSLRFRNDRISDRHCTELFHDLAIFAAHLHVSGGEPFLDTRFLKFLKSENVPALALSITTNGSLLDDEILEVLSRFPYINLHISIDSFNPELFSRLRKGPLGLEKILGKIKLARNFIQKQSIDAPGPKWHIAIQFILLAENIEEIPSYILKARDLGFNEIGVCRLDKYYPEHDPVDFLRKWSQEQRDILFREFDGAIGASPGVETNNLKIYLAELLRELQDG